MEVTGSAIGLQKAAMYIKEGENMNGIIEAMYISEWTSGERIETPCKVNTDTKEVFDITQSSCVPDGVCEAEYVEIDRQEFPVYLEDSAGDGEFWRD